MRSIAKFVFLAGLVGASAGCEDDDLGFTGAFELTITETEDTCDGSNDVIFSQVDISGTAQAITLTFNEDAVLTGSLNAQNFFDVSGNVIVPVAVQGDTVDVESFMEMIFEVAAQGRRLDIEEGSALTYMGTHPSAPGVTCIQEFVGQGQRTDD
jgi:hypothetical protein